MIRDGCAKIIAALSTIPLVEDLSWSGVDYRFWWVRFGIRCQSPLAWGVIRRLAWALNTSVLERWRREPFVLKPDREETLSEEENKEVIYWVIASTAPLLDPAEVAEDLQMVLLSGIQRESDGTEF